VDEYRALREILEAAAPNRELAALLRRWIELRYFGTRGFGAIYMFYGVRPGRGC
jgi:demethylmenaquinone methyltransferase/2-methoxy-6-polyprenyl-1,4-benzoquinol methylase